MAISMLKIRRPLGRLIFNMGIAIPGKTVFLIETAPWCIFMNVCVSFPWVWPKVTSYIVKMYCGNRFARTIIPTVPRPRTTYIRGRGSMPLLKHFSWLCFKTNDIIYDHCIAGIYNTMYNHLIGSCLGFHHVAHTSWNTDSLWIVI